MQPDRDDLVPVFAPALVRVLCAQEKEKGQPLSQQEVEQIRDEMPCMLVTEEIARKLDGKRLIRDIDPENCWDDWQEWRKNFGEHDLPDVPEFDRRNTDSKMILCVPGPWQDKSDFVQRVAEETAGEFLCLGNQLAQPKAKRQVEVDFTEPHPNMRQAFELAGQGRFDLDLLEAIQAHQSIAYLLFDASVEDRLADVRDFCRVLQQVGGLGVKVETTGIAHRWEAWFEILEQDEPFVRYGNLVLLLGDENYYYSCGMQNFNLPDIEVPASLEIDDAAELMNQYNFWQIVEAPQILSGETFSVTPSDPYYRILHLPDLRQEGTPFQNPRGIWRLVPNP